MIKIKHFTPDSINSSTHHSCNWGEESFSKNDITLKSLLYETTAMKMPRIHTFITGSFKRQTKTITKTAIAKYKWITRDVLGDYNDDYDDGIQYAHNQKLLSSVFFYLWCQKAKQILFISSCCQYLVISWKTHPKWSFMIAHICIPNVW